MTAEIIRPKFGTEDSSPKKIKIEKDVVLEAAVLICVVYAIMLLPIWAPFYVGYRYWKAKS